MTYFKRVFSPPKQSFFLFGPRGTGKTTYIRHQFPNALWIDLIQPEQLRRFSAAPERLNEEVYGDPAKKVIVIDEVQNVPMLLSVVHSLIEEKKGRQFILTGSSSRKLRRTGANLLGGRAVRCMLHPFMATELGVNFSLENTLQYGTLPLLIDIEDKRKALEGYIGLYLKEEIQSEGLVRNLESFSRFLEVVSFSHGSLLNISNISRECEVKRKTVENYLEILEDLLLAHQLPVFRKRAQRILVAHPKFYLFDCGVFRALRPRGPFDRTEEIEGQALEGLVAQHLLAWNDYSDQKHEIAFWRTKADLEVDFVVYGPSGIWAFEVKNSDRVFPDDLKGLRAFCEDYPNTTAILLYRGHKRLQQQQILCFPVEEFLHDLKPNSAFISPSAE